MCARETRHVATRYPASIGRALRLLVVTPDMHKVHHSREQIETDTNYSNIFSFWDRVFGTYTSTINFGELWYGLEGFDVRDRQTLRALLTLPFRTTGR